MIIYPSFVQRKNRKKINALFSDESDPFEAKKNAKDLEIKEKTGP